MMSKLIIFVFYSTSAIIYTFGLYYNFVNCVFPEHNGVYESTVNKLQYLTTWDSVLQCVYFTLCSIAVFHNFSSKTEDTVLNKLCNSIHIGLSFPFGLLVTFLFWIIFTIDRELVFPKSFDLIIPNWLNHILHSMPLITSFIDSYLVHHHYPSFYNGIGLTILFTVSYFGLTLYNALVNGIWVYPLLKVLNVIERSLFFTVTALVVIGLYKIGEITNSIFWPNNQIKKKIN